MLPASAPTSGCSLAIAGRELGPADRPNLLDSLRLDDSNSIEEIKVPQSFIRPILRDLNLRKNYEVNLPGSPACEQSCP